MADQDSKDRAALDVLMGQLSGAGRRGRQEAAHTIEAIAKASPDALVPYAPKLIDALGRPEAQTRWEDLSALSEIAKVDASSVVYAFDGAEASLFDETSAAVRLQAFRFIAQYGATSEQRSEESWPLLDEAIQCYHGDPEYRDMLVCLQEFVQGSISDKVRAAVGARVGFDAQNGRGYTKTFSKQILEECSRK